MTSGERSDRLVVANQPRPGNEPRAVRVDQALWDAAKVKAEGKGETVSDVIRRALERYVK